MSAELKELIVNHDLRIRKRDGGDMSKWMNSIESVLFPTSIKGSVLRKGIWEDCIVSASLTGQGSEYINLMIYYSDATHTAVSGRKTSFYTEEYNAALRREKEEKARERSLAAKRRRARQLTKSLFST